MPFDPSTPMRGTSVLADAGVAQTPAAAMPVRPQLVAKLDLRCRSFVRNIT
jgi:hypothetical protein